MPGHSSPWTSLTLGGTNQLRPYRFKSKIPAPLKYRSVTKRVHVLGRLADGTGDPILKQALKEPIAFWGGFVAGVLGLNLEEDPLKTWIKRTASNTQETPTPSQSIQERSSWAMPSTKTQQRNGVSPYSAGGQEAM
ncbi:g7066 [Coccomyxa elongata]